MTKRSFSAPDDVVNTPKAKTEVIKLGDRTVSKITFAPGWQWSKDVKPIVGTKSCLKHHFGYTISGRMRTRMDDGTELDWGAGDMVNLPPGHDGWVLGNEPVVLLDFGDPCSCG
jgi:hypothetical protein